MMRYEWEPGLLRPNVYPAYFPTFYHHLTELPITSNRVMVGKKECGYRAILTHEGFFNYHGDHVPIAMFHENPFKNLLSSPGCKRKYPIYGLDGRFVHRRSKGHYYTTELVEQEYYSHSFWNELDFVVHDCIPGMPGLTFPLRNELLKLLPWDGRFRYTDYRIMSYHETCDYYKQCMGEGAIGILLPDSDSVYVKGYNRNFFYYQPTKWEHGKCVYKDVGFTGQMEPPGSLIVRWENLYFEIEGGFTKSQCDNPSLIPKNIRFIFSIMNDDGFPICPSYAPEDYWDIYRWYVIV